MCVDVCLNPWLFATVCLCSTLVIRDFLQVSTKLRIEFEERCNYWIKKNKGWRVRAKRQRGEKRGMKEVNGS